MLRMFDRLFVDQLFATNARGDTIYSPNGGAARGYLVPPERAQDVRARVRRLVLAAQIGVPLLVVLLPYAVERGLGFSLPLPWLIGGVLVVLVALVAAVIFALARISAGLAAVSPRA